VLLEQVRAGQRLQQPPRLSLASGGQRGGAWDADVRPGGQGGQPEHPLRVGRLRPVGPREHGSHRCAGIIGASQHVQPVVGGRELGDQGSQRLARPCGGAVGGDPQRQRQEPTARRDVGDRRQLGVGAARAEYAAQQRDGLPRRKRFQADPDRAVACGQPRQPVAAGHDHGAAGRCGQQRPDLPGGDGVVEHDEDPLAVQQRPVHRSGLV
jgi:hypothetical protein